MPTSRASRSQSPRPRLPLIVTTVSCLGIIALGWFLGAAPALDSAALARVSIVSTEAQNVQHRATLVTLAEQHSRLDAIRAEATTLRREVPAALLLPDLVDQMSAVAAAHAVTITRFLAEEPVSPLALAAATQPATAEPVTAEPTAVEPVTAEPTAVDPATTADPAAAADPEHTTPSSRLTATNLYAVPITLTLTGSPTDARATLGELQHGERLFFVTSAKLVLTEPAAESISEVRGYAYVLLGER